MRPITPKLTKSLEEHFVQTNLVATGPAYKIAKFEDLISLIAELSYLNKEFLLYFRGQKVDFINVHNNKSTFYPSIYRAAKGKLVKQELNKRFDILESASIILAEKFKKNKIHGYVELVRKKEIQWSILQHYEVCDTPYLDLTQSLRVACSFAVLPDSKGQQPTNAYLYAFAIPYPTNRISINSEHDLINIRLLSISPPSALRPHYQEGFTLGTTDITHDYEDKQELDFNNRLVAKFEFQNNDSFWTGNFLPIAETDLYPENDMVLKICDEIKQLKNNGVLENPLEEFVKLWQKFECLLKLEVPNFISIQKSTKYLINSFLIVSSSKLNSICKFKEQIDKNTFGRKREVLINYILLYELDAEISKAIAKRN
jgi:hypothetical protein